MVEYVGVVEGVKPYVDDVPQPDSYFIAIAVSKSGRVVAYTCDGFGERASFAGRSQDGEIDVPSEDGAAQITSTISGSSAKGELTFEGETYPFTLKKAKGVGGLYTVDVEQSDGGTTIASGVSERGNKLKSTAKPGQQRFAVTVTTVDGSKTRLVATPLSPPEEFLGFDAYRFVLLDNKRMGRGNPTVTAVQLPPITPVSVTTALRLTSTLMVFY